MMVEMSIGQQSWPQDLYHPQEESLYLCWSQKDLWPQPQSSGLDQLLKIKYCISDLFFTIHEDQPTMRMPPRASLEYLQSMHCIRKKVQIKNALHLLIFSNDLKRQTSTSLAKLYILLLLYLLCSLKQLVSGQVAIEIL